MNKTEQHKKAVIEALEKSLGVVTTACKNAGVGRTQFYTWSPEDVFKPLNIISLPDALFCIVVLLISKTDCKFNSSIFSLNSGIMLTCAEDSVCLVKSTLWLFSRLNKAIKVLTENDFVAPRPPVTIKNLVSFLNKGLNLSFSCIKLN